MSLQVEKLEKNMAKLTIEVNSSPRAATSYCLFIYVLLSAMLS